MKKNDKIKFIDIINLIMDDDDKAAQVSLGALLIVFFVVPLTVGILLLFLVNDLTPVKMAAMFLPSLTASAFYWVFKDWRWFKKVF